MDNPLYAMLFAEDLIEYVLKKFNIHWKRPEGVNPLRDCISRNRFKNEIGEAVYSIILQNEEVCKKNFRALIQRGLITPEKYRYKSSLLTVQIFKEGFHPDAYLSICASLAAHTWQSFRELIEDRANDIASISSQILAFILNFYIYKAEFNPFTDWFLLVIRAQKARRILAMQKTVKA